MELGNVGPSRCFTKTFSIVGKISTIHLKLLLALLDLEFPRIEKETSWFLRSRRNHVNDGVWPEKDGQQIECNLLVLNESGELVAGRRVMILQEFNQFAQVEYLRRFWFYSRVTRFKLSLIREQDIRVDLGKSQGRLGDFDFKYIAHRWFVFP